ncbi:hypothetical protein H4W31_005805 [Plantactinospora soyae]|uniref:Uncharacterized protein n=1 Tax=Plantactinospora soyae TaxID=1544732 RepID=A0A927MAK5_9ACTN|nr:hypothetical protein [Plantactinospora soyae]
MLMISLLMSPMNVGRYPRPTATGKPAAGG